MGPVVAPGGTDALIDVAETTVKLAAVPLNFTAVVLVKSVPVTLTCAPSAPEAGEKPVTVGARPGPTGTVGDTVLGPPFMSLTTHCTVFVPSVLQLLVTVGLLGAMVPSPKFQE